MGPSSFGCLLRNHAFCRYLKKKQKIEKQANSQTGTAKKTLYSARDFLFLVLNLMLYYYRVLLNFSVSQKLRAAVPRTLAVKLVVKLGVKLVAKLVSQTLSERSCAANTQASSKVSSKRSSKTSI